MEAEAMCDYISKDEAELGFRKGDTLVLLDYGDDTNWYAARSDAGAGIVPLNYITVIPASWYYGRVSRVVAERILMSSSYEGAFLVRLSESSPRDFSLSVKCGNSVQHFRILKDEEDNYRLWPDGPSFLSINRLVEQYKHETVSRTRQILLRKMDDFSPPKFIAQAVFDFSPDQDNELGFKKGDFIWVTDTNDEHWWLGEIGPLSGYFPRLYVTPFNLESVKPKELNE